MSILFSTHTVKIRKALPQTATYNQALSLLQDVEAFPLIQPLTTTNVPASSPPAVASWTADHVAKTLSSLPPGSQVFHRAITADVPMFGGFKSSVTTHSSYVVTPTGLTVHFEAPMGLKGTDVWSIQGEEGKLELVEEAELTGLKPMMGFVMSSKKTSHTELGERFAKKLKGETL